MVKHGVAEQGRDRSGTPYARCRCGESFEAAHAEDVETILIEHLESVA